MGEVAIGDYSYIGAHSVIMPGSKLGKGVIVSAFCYVDGIFPDYAILRGIPAQIVGSTKDRDEELLREFPELRTHYYNNQ
jgi:acetyltransferase-like isoleucine patch superfamily enzyme